MIKQADIVILVESNDYRLFCIAHTVDLAESSGPSDIEHDQSCMGCIGRASVFPRNQRILSTISDTFPETIVVVSLQFC